MRRLPAYLYVADLVPGKRVLEVGCGDGDGAAFLARCGAARVLGVDGSREQVDRARRRHRLVNLELRCEDAARLELEDGSVDLAFVPDAARLLRRREVVDELRRVLVAGGWLIACTASADRPERGRGAADGGMSFHELGERLQPLFAPVRVAAQSPFVGVSLCEYAPGDTGAPPVALDRSLIDPAGDAEVTGYLAICGGPSGPPRGFTLVELPAAEAADLRAAAAPPAHRHAPPPAPEPATVSEQIAAALAEHARSASARETALAESQEWADELRGELERERLRLAASAERVAEAEEAAEELRGQLHEARARAAVAEGEVLRLQAAHDVDLAAELAETRRKLERATENWKQAEGKNDEVWRRVGELQTELGALREQTMESARRQRQQSQVDLARALEKASLEVLSVQERLTRAERDAAEQAERLRREQERRAELERAVAEAEAARTAAPAPAPVAGGAVPDGVRRGVDRLERELADARALVDELAGAVAELHRVASSGGGPGRSLAVELGVREAELTFLTIGLSSLQARVREAVGQVRDVHRSMQGRSPEEMLALVARLEDALRGLA